MSAQAHSTERSHSVVLFLPGNLRDLRGPKEMIPGTELRCLLPYTGSCSSSPQGEDSLSLTMALDSPHSSRQQVTAQHSTRITGVSFRPREAGVRQSETRWAGSARPILDDVMAGGDDWLVTPE